MAKKKLAIQFMCPVCDDHRSRVFRSFGTASRAWQSHRDSYEHQRKVGMRWLKDSEIEAS